MTTKDGRELRQLTADELAGLRPTGHQSAIELSDGTWAEVNGYSGLVNGVQSSDWVTTDGRTTGWTRR